MLAGQAYLLAGVACTLPVMYLLYRSIVPYEAAMADFRLAGALFYPAIMGFGIGIAHIALDLELLAGGWGALSYLILYPAIESYAVLVVFNRTFFFKQPEAPIYFAVGGGALAFGLGLVETFRALLASGREATDVGLLAAMIALAAAFVLFHSSKGLLLGTYTIEGSRTRGILVSVAIEVPFGALLLTSRFVGGDYVPLLALLLLYAAACYYFVWHRFFPLRMPDAMRKALDRERKSARRRSIAKRQN